MIETDSTQDRSDSATADAGWPTTDRAADGAPAAHGTESTADAPESTAEAAASAPEATAPTPVAASDERRSGKRENPLVAGLVKAMREAAVASRAETTTRLQAEAAERIEAIRAGSTDEAAALRKRVDEDIAEIREWSKVEMARIKAETEHRIEERRADAINESQRHLDAVENLVGQVQSTVSNFESDMDRFFERLLAENDPARLAALAEQAPEPPDLSGELPKATGWTAMRSDDTTGETDSVDDTGGYAAGPEEVQALEASAAAEAEAAATEGLDLSTAEEWPAAVMAAARRSGDDVAVPSDEAAMTSKVLVSGLSSVAGISAFKGAIGGLPGVRSVSVSTGERGVFVYTVNHDPETDVAAQIGELSAFSVEITEATDDGLTVTAHEPAA